MYKENQLQLGSTTYMQFQNFIHYSELSKIGHKKYRIKSNLRRNKFLLTLKAAEGLTA